MRGSCVVRRVMPTKRKKKTLDDVQRVTLLASMSATIAAGLWAGGHVREPVEEEAFNMALKFLAHAEFQFSDSEDSSGLSPLGK